MIRVFTDSTASIPHDVAEKTGIEVATMYVNYRGKEYQDATMDLDAFYEDIYEMVNDIPTSSQPSSGQLEGMFEAAAEAGDEVIGVFMSSDMSGVVNGALQAARAVAARHEGFQFRIVDAMSNSFDEAWAVFAVVAARDAGATLDECCAIACKAVASSRFLFSPESLRFLKAGGRIGTASALLGTIMKICPILTVTDGVTTTFAKVRTQKKALAAIADKFGADVREYGLKNVIVHYIGSSDTARDWAKRVIEPLSGRPVPVIPVSACIGLHVGPAVGITYECEHVLPGKLSPGVVPAVYSS